MESRHLGSILSYSDNFLTKIKNKVKIGVILKQFLTFEKASVQWICIHKI
jgi:hypothetical protein